MMDTSKDLKVGNRIKVATVAYLSCVEDGYPFLDVGNFGTIVHVYPTGDLAALYNVQMDGDPDKTQDWPFWNGEVEEVK
jgi:hypothetical protein